MFIAIPKEFFVPVLFSDEFNFNVDTNRMEYNTEKNKNLNTDSRRKLFDNDGQDVIVQSSMRKIEKDEYDKLDEHIKHVTDIFMMHIKKIECLKVSDDEINNSLNMHIGNFKKVYENHINMFSSMSKILTPSDIDGIVDNHVNRFIGIFEKHLKKLNCNNMTTKQIEKVLEEHIIKIKGILRKHIEKLNCSIINTSEECKLEKIIKERFIYSKPIFETIDNEFVNSVIK